jgi:hypothetical protein
MSLHSSNNLHYWPILSMKNYVHHTLQVLPKSAGKVSAYVDKIFWDVVYAQTNGLCDELSSVGHILLKTHAYAVISPFSLYCCCPGQISSLVVLGSKIRMTIVGCPYWCTRVYLINLPPKLKAEPQLFYQYSAWDSERSKKKNGRVRHEIECIPNMKMWSSAWNQVKGEKWRV